VVGLYLDHLHVFLNYFVILRPTSTRVEVGACPHAVHFDSAPRVPSLSGRAHLRIRPGLLHYLRFFDLPLSLDFLLALLLPLLLSQVLFLIVLRVKVDDKFSLGLITTAIPVFILLLLLLMLGVVDVHS
jgi:hypothetical protein